MTEVQLDIHSRTSATLLSLPDNYLSGCFIYKEVDSTGPDMIRTYWTKKLTALHRAARMNELLMNKAHRNG